MSGTDAGIAARDRQALEQKLSAGNSDCLFEPKAAQLPVRVDGSGNVTLTTLLFPQQHATSGAPAYVKGAIYFDTTLNKLRVGGATAWETITSV